MRRSLVATAATLALALITACGGVQHETQHVKLHIDTDPPGAWVSRIDDTGKQSIGQAPLDTEVVATRERIYAGPGAWISSGILAALTAGLTAWTFSSDETTTQGIAGGL